MQIPPDLKARLLDGVEAAAVLQLVHAVDDISSDNKTPFFPGYTDHSRRHIEHVVADSWRLLSPSAQALMTSCDAAVLIGACLLHDLGMHLREEGFVRLITPGAWPPPLDWFDKRHGSREPDRPWGVIWDEYKVELRHASSSFIRDRLGVGDGQVPPIAFSTRDAEPASWHRYDHLAIGEFLRRHHARLAHEIALAGFPDTSPSGFTRHFPVLRETLPDLAEAIGVTARSHNEALRLAVSYCDYMHPNTLSPWGAYVPVHMGLLRVADYAQLDWTRAPSLLLDLRLPLGPTSRAEWDKHRAVRSVLWTDPGQIYVSVSTEHDLAAHLGLRRLLEGLQTELDTTAALFSERYGGSAGVGIQLSKTRVVSNLDEPSLVERLKYEAADVRLRSDPNLFQLLIGDLYGQEPVLAGRELLQNAVDAVREAGRQGEPSVEQAPVRFRVIADPDGDGFLLRVEDDGIGMTAKTIERYYLTAGASHGPTPESFDGMIAEKRARSLKAGRFGVGVCASFLLADVVNVSTRHRHSAHGFAFDVHNDGRLVRLDKIRRAPGTTVEVRLGTVTTLAEAKGFVMAVGRFFRLSHPSVSWTVETDTIEHLRVVAGDQLVLPPSLVSPVWRAIPQEFGFDLVCMSPDGRGEIIHNGLLVDEARASRRFAYAWSDQRLNRRLAKPSVAIFDSSHKLPLSLDRTKLQTRHLPCEEALIDAMGVELTALVLSAPAEVFRSPPVRDAVSNRSSLMPLLPSLLHQPGRATAFLCVHEDETFGDSLPEAIRRYNDEVDEDAPCLVLLPMTDQDVDATANPFRDPTHAAVTQAEMLSAQLIMWARFGGSPNVTRDDLSLKNPPSFLRVWVAGSGLPWPSYSTVGPRLFSKLDNERAQEEVRQLAEEPPAHLFAALSAIKAAVGASLAFRTFSIAFYETPRSGAARPTFDEALTAPWRRLVGDEGLSRSADRRGRQIRRATEAEPRLVSAIEYWERRWQVEGGSRGALLQPIFRLDRVGTP